MLTTIGKFFASIAVGVSSLFGVHHTQQVQPVSVPPIVASSTSSVSTSPTITSKAVSPSNRVATPKSVPAAPAAKSSVVTDNQAQAPVTSTPVPVVTTPTPAVAPTPTPKPIPLPKVKVTATPSSVAYDGTSAISWVATDTTSCTLDSSPVLLAPTGSQVVHPANPNYQDWLKPVATTYTVTCTGAGGSASGSAAVTVTWAPPAGYKFLPTGQCSRATAPCTTGPVGTSCEFGGGCASGG